MEAMSCPIKVVSKPEQIRKKRKEANQEPELEGSKKRARSEDVLVELRQLQSVLTPAIEALKQQQQSRINQIHPADAFTDDVSMDLSEDTFADEDGLDDFETTTNITTDDERTRGEPNSITSYDDESVASAAPYAPRAPRNGASLTSAFESMLLAFDEAMADPTANAQDIAARAPIERLRAAVNFLGLEQPALLDTDDYH